MDRPGSSCEAADVGSRLTELLHCEHPIQLAPMGSVSVTAALPLAVARAGAHAVLPALGAPPRALAPVVDALAEDTAAFGVNFLVPVMDRRSLELAAARADYVDFFLADPDPALVAAVHDGGARCGWQVESAEEARAAEASAAARRSAEQQAGKSAPARSAAPAPSGTSATSVARITNRAGSVKPQVQAAADAVVSNVPGAGAISIGGTRASAADPGGHPSGLALDYMVGSNGALGDAIAQYHIAHWKELGVQYVIWKQRMLSSPNGSWRPMENRGSATANHMDHVHVNYLP